MATEFADRRVADDSLPRASEEVGGRAWLGRQIGRGALPLLAALAVTSGMLFGGFNSAAGEATSAIINTLLLGAIFVVKTPPPRFWRSLLAPLACVAAALIWILLVHWGVVLGPGWPRPIAYAPDMFNAKLLGLIGGIAALVSGCLVASNRWQINRILDLIVVFACVTFLAGLVMRVVGTDGALAYWDVMRRGRFAGTIGNINVTAAAAGMVVLIAFGRLLGRAPGRSHQSRSSELAVPLLHGAAIIIALGTMLVTAARFPLLVLMGLCLLLATFSFARSTGSRRLLGTLVAVMAVAGALFVAYSGQVLERFGALGAELAVRELMWAHYYHVGMASWLYGYGPGAFSSVNLHSLTSLKLQQTLWPVNSAHNIILQLLLVGGLPYLLLLSAAFLTIGLRVFRFLLSKKRRIEEWGVAAAIAMVLLCSLVDIVLDVRATVTLTLFLAGLLWGRSLPSRRLSRYRPLGSPA